MDHDPPILSDDEFTQHTDDEHFLHGVGLAKDRPLREKKFTYRDGGREYFDRNARRFLISHPKCTLELVSENGERRTLNDSEGTE